HHAVGRALDGTVRLSFGQLERSFPALFGYRDHLQSSSRSPSPRGPAIGAGAARPPAERLRAARFLAPLFLVDFFADFFADFFSARFTALRLTLRNAMDTPSADLPWRYSTTLTSSGTG